MRLQVRYKYDTGMAVDWDPGAVPEVRGRAGEAVLGPRRAGRDRPTDRPRRRPRVRRRCADGAGRRPARGRRHGRHRQLAGDARRRRAASPVPACGSSSATSARGAGRRGDARRLRPGARQRQPAVGPGPSARARQVGGGAGAAAGSWRCRCRPTPIIRRTCWPPRWRRRSRSRRRSTGRRRPTRSPPTCCVPEDYATLLHDLGFAEQLVRLQVYGHVLDSTASSSSGCAARRSRGSSSVSPPSCTSRSSTTYRRALLVRLGEHAPYFYPFKRILHVGSALTIRSTILRSWGTHLIHDS